MIIYLDRKDIATVHNNNYKPKLIITLLKQD